MTSHPALVFCRSIFSSGLASVWIRIPGHDYRDYVSVRNRREKVGATAHLE
jgi:hypothetical protein